MKQLVQLDDPGVKKIWSTITVILVGPVAYLQIYQIRYILDNLLSFKHIYLVSTKIQ